MSAQVIDLTAARQQLSEHKSLRRLSADILRLAELCPDSPAEDPSGEEQLQRWIVDLQDLLGQLDVSLKEHFAAEEASDMYTPNHPEFGRFQRELEALLAEHPKMLGDVAKLCAQTSPKSVKPLVAGTLALVQTLKAHETAENDILQAAYGDDLGDGD